MTETKKSSRKSALIAAYRAAFASVLILVLGGCASPREPTYSGAPEHPTTTSEGKPLRPIVQDAVRILSRAIQIPTVNPPGNEAALARFYADELDRAGLETRIIETPDASGSSLRAAVWARLPGNGSKRPLILLSHLDVVAAVREDWREDPFAGLVDERYVHGRGSLDAKGVGTIQLVALKELALRTEPLERDVIFLATPDEESGGRSGAGYLTRRHPELLMNAEYLLTEGGGIRPESDATPATWGITITEKSPCWIEVIAHGTPGHSAAPRRDAAVPRLIAALDRIRRIESPIHVLPEVAVMFATLAPILPGDDQEAYANLAESLEGDSAFRRRFLRTPGFNALVRNTISLTVLKGSERTNVAPSQATAQLDARLLPGESCDQFRTALEEVVDDTEIELRPLLAFSSRSSSPDSELYRAIERVAAATEPEAILVPRVIGGFTDAHWFRELGIVSYGFVPRRLTPEDARGVHGPDESISIENLDNGIRLMIQIIEELAAPKN